MESKGKVILSVMVMVFLFCCSGITLAQNSGSMGGQETVTGKAFPGVFLKKIDNFEIILDGSMSMTEKAGDTDKLGVAKAVVKQMTSIMPDLKLIGACRLCGCNSCPYSQETRLIYGPEYFTKKGLNMALDSVEKAAGSTPMARSIREAGNDLAKLEGKSAVIVVSDGVDVKLDAIKAAAELKSSLKDRVNIYTIWVGDDQKGKSILDRIAQAGGTEKAYSASKLLSGAPEMAGFVEAVFLQEVFDSDHDGVFDHEDKCPDTPRGIAVDKQGCPLDSDGDGVPDSLDRCPRTPAGAKVMADGCWAIGSIHFDFDKAEIKPSAYPILDNVVMVMKKNPDLKIIIEGHTDIIGTEAYNLRLSKRRALSAKKYLTRHGISSDRIKVKGYGFSRPIATNETEEGRAKNRRVEFKPQRR